MSVRPLVGASSKASLKNTLSIDGNRRSPSISKVLRPCCAKATAQLIAQKLLPSEGSALVNKNVLHISSCGNKDNAARKLRKDSAAAEPGCFTRTKQSSSDFIFRAFGMSASAATPRRSSASLAVLKERSIVLASTASPQPTVNPPKMLNNRIRNL